MSIAAIALLAALTGAPQADVPPAPPAPPRSEVRIVTMGGPGAPDGPGRLDADGDGVVTREEFSAPMGSAFDRLDADHDGRLSREELAAGHPEPGGPDGPGPRVMMMRRGPGGPEGGPPAHGGPGERRVEIRRFGGPDGHDGLDADKDGKVSEAEFLAPVRDAFRSMDANHDGSLEEGEGHPTPPPPPPLAR